MQANYGANEINSLLSKVRIFNREIGTYEMFAITDSFDYAVKLSNGRINIKIEELQDDERDALTPERLTAIANRFVSSTAKTSTSTQQPPQQKQTTTIAQPPKKKKRTGLIVFIILLVILIVGALVMVNNNPNAIPGIKLQVNTPKPVVITSRADNSKSGLFKARTTVYATIQNQGGDGNVLVTFHVFQDGNDYDRTKSIYMRANESNDLDVTFEEVKLLGGDITFRVESKSE